MLFTLVFSVHVNQLDSKHVLHMLEPFVIVLPFTVRDWLGGTPRPTQRDGWRTQNICGKGHWLYVYFSFAQSLSLCHGFLMLFSLLWLFDLPGPWNGTPKYDLHRVAEACYQATDHVLWERFSGYRASGSAFFQPHMSIMSLQDLDGSNGLYGRITSFWIVPGSPGALLCQGDLDVLDMLLFTGDSENKFPGDINTQRSWAHVWPCPLIPSSSLSILSHISACCYLNWKGSDGNGRSGGSSKLVYNNTRSGSMMSESLVAETK